MSKIDEAVYFYSKFICDISRNELLTKYNLPVDGSVAPKMWELFGAILVGAKGSGGFGADLCGWEIKSASTTSVFEYQYHRNTWAEKFEEDSTVNHLFCSYANNYQDVTVRMMSGADLTKNYFDIWKLQCAENYNPKNSKSLRFRKSITQTYVNAHGKLLLTIKNAKPIYRVDALLEEVSISARHATLTVPYHQNTLEINNHLIGQFL